MTTVCVTNINHKHFNIEKTFNVKRRCHAKSTWEHYCTEEEDRPIAISAYTKSTHTDFGPLFQQFLIYTLYFVYTLFYGKCLSYIEREKVSDAWMICMELHYGTNVRKNFQNQNQNCLLVPRPNDNHSSGPVLREVSP